MMTTIMVLMILRKTLSQGDGQHYEGHQKYPCFHHSKNNDETQNFDPKYHLIWHHQQCCNMLQTSHQTPGNIMVKYD